MKRAPFLHGLRRPGRVAAVLSTLLLLVAGLLVVAVLDALEAKRSLEAAEEALVPLRQQEVMLDEATLQALGAARQHTRRARDGLDGVAVDVVAVLPVVGRSWRAERAVADLADDVLTSAVVVAEGLPTLAVQDGQVDLAALESVMDELDGPVRRASSALDRLSRTSTRLTPPPVAGAVQDARTALTPAVAGLEDAVLGLRAVRGVLGAGGRRSLLVALGNSAELRGSGGYVSSFATGSFEEGRLRLDPLQDLAAVADAPADADRVQAPVEYVEDFGPLSANTTQFRSWNMSPDFPASAEVGARITEVLLGEEPDLVVLLDVPALTSLARLGGGDVDVGERTVSPEELQDALLVDAYAAAGEDGQAQRDRRAELQVAAGQAVSRLLSGRVPIAEAARTVRELTRGRHLQVWSSNASEQLVLDRLGASGSLAVERDQDLLHVSVNNIGANKLDLYVDRVVHLDAVVGQQEAEVTQRVAFTNNAPAGLVPYVAGEQQPGTAISRVEFSLSPNVQVRRVTVNGSTVPARVRAGPARTRVVVRLEVPRGRAADVAVQYSRDLNDGEYRLVAVPQALAKDASLVVDIASTDGRPLRRTDVRAPVDAPVREQVVFDRSVEVAVAPPQQDRDWTDRLRQFWKEPVTIG